MNKIVYEEYLKFHSGLTLKEEFYGSLCRMLFENLRKLHMQIYFLSRDVLSCSAIEISAWLLECTGLKPVNNVICKLYVNFLFSRKEYSLLWRSFSIIFPMFDNNEMGR